MSRHNAGKFRHSNNTIPYQQRYIIILIGDNKTPFVMKRRRPRDKLMIYEQCDHITPRIDPERLI